MGNSTKSTGLRVAVVGATGLVGQTMLRVLQERDFPVRELLPVTSERSQGQEVVFRHEHVAVMTNEEAIERQPELVLMSAGGAVSAEWCPKYVAAGATVIDNSSAWRMTPEVPLVVPEVNAETIGEATLIANPNCSTIQLVVALAPLQRLFGLERVMVSTYQAVSGTGRDALDQLSAELLKVPGPTVYPHSILHNVLPHCDVFQEDGYTREETKVMQESRKILGLPGLRISCTAVRVPVKTGHSESVSVQLVADPNEAHVRAALQGAPGVILEDDPSRNHYPMPLTANGHDEVFVGRIRRDLSAERSWHLWVVADNLRKGAATNAVQIAELILSKGM